MLSMQLRKLTWQSERTWNYLLCGTEKVGQVRMYEGYYSCICYPSKDACTVEFAQGMDYAKFKVEEMFLKYIDRILISDTII